MEYHHRVSAGISLVIWRRYVRLQRQPKSTRKPPMLDPGILYLSQTNMAMTNATPADINKIKLKVTSITRSPRTRSIPPPASEESIIIEFMESGSGNAPGVFLPLGTTLNIF